MLDKLLKLHTVRQWPNCSAQEHRSISEIKASKSCLGYLVIRKPGCGYQDSGYQS